MSKNRVVMVCMEAILVIINHNFCLPLATKGAKGYQAYFVGNVIHTGERNYIPFSEIYQLDPRAVGHDNDGRLVIAFFIFIVEEPVEAVSTHRKRIKPGSKVVDFQCEADGVPCGDADMQRVDSLAVVSLLELRSAVLLGCYVREIVTVVFELQT